MKFRQAAPEYFLNMEFVLNSIERRVLETPDQMESLNQNMFRDDFGNIFIGSARRNADLFNITSNNDKIQEQLMQSFVRAVRYSRNENVFQELLEEIIQSLLYNGKAVYFFSNESSGEPAIQPLRSNTIFRCLGILFQYLPKRVERNWDKDDEQFGREIRFLKRDQVLFFDWPKSVRRKIQSQNRILKMLDRYAFDGVSKHIAQPTHENPNPKNDFNFSIWRDTRDEALFKATRFTGWSCRDSSYPNKSDFFICHRLVRFRKLQIETCIHILDSLSEQLTSIGRLHSAQFEMRVSFSENFPSISKFDDLESSLEREEASFSEVIDYCFNKGD